MKIDVRMNLRTRTVELKIRPGTPDTSNLLKCQYFVHAFMLGFDVSDAEILLKDDDFYVASFDTKDIWTPSGITCLVPQAGCVLKRERSSPPLRKQLEQRLWLNLKMPVFIY